MYKHCEILVIFEVIAFLPHHSQTYESIFILFVFKDVNSMYTIHICMYST